MHLAFLGALLWVSWPPPAARPPQIVPLDLAAWRRLAAAHQAPSRTGATREPPPRLQSRPAASLAAASPLTQGDAPMADAAGVSDGELAGAAAASGAGGACDMAGRIQDALRKDPLVREAVAGFEGRAVKVWNGDWVWIDGEEGKGLPAVRQAIMWEVAFAPADCRSTQMRGLIVVSVPAPGGGVARIALGAPQWRWRDLLTQAAPGIPQ